MASDDRKPTSAGQARRTERWLANQLALTEFAIYDTTPSLWEWCPLGARFEAAWIVGPRTLWLCCERPGQLRLERWGNGHKLAGVAILPDCTLAVRLGLLRDAAVWLRGDEQDTGCEEAR